MSEAAAPVSRLRDELMSRAVRTLTLTESSRPCTSRVCLTSARRSASSASLRSRSQRALPGTPCPTTAADMSSAGDCGRDVIDDVRWVCPSLSSAEGPDRYADMALLDVWAASSPLCDKCQAAYSRSPECRRGFAPTSAMSSSIRAGILRARRRADKRRGKPNPKP